MTQFFNDPSEKPATVNPGMTFDFHSESGRIEVKSSGAKGWYQKLYGISYAQGRDKPVNTLNPKRKGKDADEGIQQDTGAGRFVAYGGAKQRITHVASSVQYTVRNDGPENLTVSYILEKSGPELSVIITPGNDKEINSYTGDIYVKSANAKGSFQLDGMK